MIIKFEPHGFVVFLTLAMGMVYTISNSRSGWGFWKIALTAIFVFPTLYYGFIIGRVVEVVLGSIIGWVYGRGGISLPYFRLNPFGGIGIWLRNRQFDHDQRCDEKWEKREQSKAEKKQSSSYDDELKKRREQAQRSREKTKRQHSSNEKSESEQTYQNNKSTGSERHQTKREIPAERRKTPLEQSYETLGISSSTSFQEAKKMYRKMISRYHEDKLQDLPVSEITEANEKAKQINQAWALIKKGRGWK